MNNIHTYIPMPSGYLNRKFFTDHYIDVLEIITYYDLYTLIYYNQAVNIDLCVKFYNNLARLDEFTYTSRVGGVDIIFTPDLVID